VWYCKILLDSSLLSLWRGVESTIRLPLVDIGIWVEPTVFSLLVSLMLSVAGRNRSPRRNWKWFVPGRKKIRGAFSNNTQLEPWKIKQIWLENKCRGACREPWPKISEILDIGYLYMKESLEDRIKKMVPTLQLMDVDYRPWWPQTHILWAGIPPELKERPTITTKVLD